MTATTKATHTPGPWVVESGGSSVVTPGGRAIADIPNDIDEEEVANARLIAASPDLLSACRKILESRDPDPNSSKAVDAQIEAWGLAEAAIAKAVPND